MNSSSEITLVIRKHGHVRSLKNSKEIYQKKDGTRFVAANPKTKEQMSQIIQDLALQLLSEYRTAVSGMETAPSLQSWIASSLPSDDSRKWIIECSWKWEEVEKGEEGAVIRLYRLPDPLPPAQPSHT